MTASQRETPTQVLEFAMRNVPASVVSRFIGLGTRPSVQPSVVQLSFDQAGGGDPESSVGLPRTSETTVPGHGDHAGGNFTGLIEDKEVVVSGENRYIDGPPCA